MFQNDAATGASENSGEAGELKFSHGENFTSRVIVALDRAFGLGLLLLLPEKPLKTRVVVLPSTRQRYDFFRGSTLSPPYD